jgi:hypothetical protein
LGAIPENLSLIGAGFFLPRLGAPATGHRQGLYPKKSSPPSVRVLSWARFQKIFCASVMHDVGTPGSLLFKSAAGRTESRLAYHL